MVACLSFIAEKGKETNWDRIRSIYQHLKMGYYTHAPKFSTAEQNPQLASASEQERCSNTNGYKKIETIQPNDQVWTHGNC